MFNTNRFIHASCNGFKISRRVFTSCNTNHNVLLMGNPGCGKTTVGRYLASILKLPCIDIDNDYLETKWGTTVSDMLSRLGADKFLEAEGYATSQFKATKSVISLTGSNPLHEAAYKHLRTQGTVIYLDVPIEDILRRCENMKISRIVGQTDDMSLSDILEYRKQFYERAYDIRVICEEAETPSQIANRIASILHERTSKRGYVSTRAVNDKAVTFNEVVLQGLAPDSGLYIPNGNFPIMSLGSWQRLISLNYTERALRILEAWIHHEDVHPSSIALMTTKAYSMANFSNMNIFNTQHLDENIYISEMFHGPTASFKDAALQIMPMFFQHALNKELVINKRYLILVATSGDTGSAVLDGFSKISSDDIDVMVLYPEKGVSNIQKAMMTRATGNNVHVVGIDSDFDFCQSAIKRIFSDQQFSSKLQDDYGMHLSAANSLNWGRLLPQVVYHASSYLDLVSQGVIRMGEPVDICVPTGNMGNILAAFYAKMMGIPFRTLICASNVNNVLTEFFNSGHYNLMNRCLANTSSPAIDILRASNMERFLYHISGNDSNFVTECMTNLSKNNCFTMPPHIRQAFQEFIVADWCTDNDCFQTIQNTFDKTGYLLDPHTAIAKTVAERFLSSDCPMLISSTAHYAKFPEDVLSAVEGVATSPNQNLPNLFSKLNGLKECTRPNRHYILEEKVSQEILHKTVLQASITNIENEILSFIQLRNQVYT